MRQIPLFLLLLFFLASCATAPKSLLKKSPYDDKFYYYAGKLSAKKQKTKHLKKMEAAYQAAQKSDLLAADSLLNLDKPDRWLYVNAYYRRMQERQQKVLSLPPLKSKEGYKPDLLIINDLAKRESSSREASANFLYQQSQAMLATGRHDDARNAYATLVTLKEQYYPVWENSPALLDSASTLGVEHILLEGDLRPSNIFLDSKWQKFYREPSARPAFDVVVSTRSMGIFVGPEWESQTNNTYTKEIETGCIEKKDSNGVVIERTPIYETVTATVTETTLEKTADASVMVEVIDGKTGALIYATPLSARYVYTDQKVSVSGDSRALPGIVFASDFSIFVPSYWEMEQRARERLDQDFVWMIRSRLWKDD